jgi:hypothetical protein
VVFIFSLISRGGILLCLETLFKKLFLKRRRKKSYFIKKKEVKEGGRDRGKKQ